MEVYIVLGGILKLSKHAIARSNQRGIPQCLIPIIMEFGTEKNKPAGAVELLLTKKNKNKLIGRLKSFIQVIERTKNKVIVLDSTLDKVITVYPRD